MKVRYIFLENLKDGEVMSGKYRGCVLNFDPCPVIVLANDLPKLNPLSQDRWEVINLGEGQFLHFSKDYTFNPQVQFPFVQLMPLPNTSEDFALHPFLISKLGLAPNDQQVARNYQEINKLFKDILSLINPIRFMNEKGYMKGFMQLINPF